MEQVKLSKKELRMQLDVSTSAFLEAGNVVEIIPTKKIKIKVPVRGKSSNNYIVGGNSPQFSISNIYWSN